MPTYLKNQRKKLGLSQAQVAQSLGVSRPTYIKLETGKSEPSQEQKVLLERVLQLTPESIEQSHELESAMSESTEIRTIPRENEQKFKQVLLYILNKVGGKPNIGQTVLYKLLYFIDFDFYEKYEEQLIGATYIKNTFGPTPISFAKLVKRMELKGEIVVVQSKYFNHDQVKYVATKEADVSCLTGRELQHIDAELQRLSNMSATQLSELSHKDTPWAVAKEKQVIEYEHVFYRPEETSVREYEPL